MQTVKPRRNHSDEHYLIDICDRVLGRTAARQHRFDWLRGDPGKNRRGAMLPVDAFYEDLGLVVEVMEDQHRQTVPFFDKRTTVSGMSRGEQRRRYDELRARLLPERGLCLVCLMTNDFESRRRRLVRETHSDEQVIRNVLRKFLAIKIKDGN